MNRHRFGPTLLVSLGLLTVGLVALATQPAVASSPQSALAQIRHGFPVYVNANSANDSFRVNQRGAGDVVALQDSGTDEYVFGQSAADFTNQLNLVDDLKIGNGTPGVTLNGEDAYIEGTLEVDGATTFDGALDLNGVLTLDEDIEPIGVETHVTTAFTYTAAAGGTVTLATIGAGEEWLVRMVLLEVTTNFDATGDDAVLLIGDGNDADGFCVLADAELQTADTEGTGWSAGWQCQAAATQGAYIDGRGGFLYDEASTETIDATISASGNDLSAGAATAHIWYTRLP